MDEHRLTEAVELLKSRDIKKRMAAVDMAVDIGSAGAVALLVKAIQDQSWSLREYAIKKMPALGRQAVKPLVRMLRDGVWYARAAALQILGSIGDASAIVHILPLIKDGNRSVADSAVKAAIVLARSSDGEVLYSALSLLDAGQREIFLSILLRNDPDLGHKIEAHLVGMPEGPKQAVSDVADFGDLSERLQGLRREFKLILKNDGRAVDDEF